MASMHRLNPNIFPSLFAALLLLAVSAVDLEAQVVQELLGNWGGQVRSRTDTILDPADTRRTQAGYPSSRADQFWVLSFGDTGGQMEGWQRYTDWNLKHLIMTRQAYGYPLRVTEVDGKEFKVEWSQGRLACEADVELKDDDTKLDGRFVCRRRVGSRRVMETVTRGSIDFERYRPPEAGGGG